MATDGIWYPASDQPPKGLIVIGDYDGDGEVEIRWVDERRCMLAGIGGGNGYFGPGWEDVANRLIIDPPSRWRFV